jgi:hypothetical protein
MKQGFPNYLGDGRASWDAHLYMGIVSPEDRAFWSRVSSAIQRGIALGILIGLHYCLNFALTTAVPPHMVGALPYLQDVIFVIFSLIYVYLAWDILTAFFPGLKVAGTAESKVLAKPKLVESEDED